MPLYITVRFQVPIGMMMSRLLNLFDDSMFIAAIFGDGRVGVLN